MNGLCIFASIVVALLATNARQSHAQEIYDYKFHPLKEDAGLRLDTVYIITPKFDPSPSLRVIFEFVNTSEEAIYVPAKDPHGFDFLSGVSTGTGHAWEKELFRHIDFKNAPRRIGCVRLEAGEPFVLSRSIPLASNSIDQGGVTHQVLTLSTSQIRYKGPSGHATLSFKIVGGTNRLDVYVHDEKTLNSDKVQIWRGQISSGIGPIALEAKAGFETVKSDLKKVTIEEDESLTKVYKLWGSNE